MHRVSGFSSGSTTAPAVEVRGFARLEAERLLPRLSEVSRTAFARQPWHMAGSHDALLRLFLSIPNTMWFAAFSADGGTAGFSVGTLLDERAIAALRLPPESEALAGDYHLTWRAVAPEWRGRGIGRRLAVRRIEAAEALDCPRILGDTTERNLGTRQMYRDLGFVDYASQHRTDGSRLARRVFFRRLVKGPRCST